VSELVKTMAMIEGEILIFIIELEPLFRIATTIVVWWT